jgi:hypothetical protein
MNLDIPELKELQTEIASLRTEVAELRAILQPSHEWWSLRQCAFAKRGGETVLGKAGKMVELESFYSTLRTRKSLRPPGEPREVGGRFCWHRSVVLPWLPQDDAEVLRGSSVPARPASSSRRRIA